MNQEYKSDVFSMLLQYQENALDIYNALNQTAYDDPNVEIKCTVYNINKGNNKKLMQACKVLNGYMDFVDKARFYLHSPKFTDNPEDALNQAINDCIAEHVLEDFFRERREEILKIIMLDWTYEHRMELEQIESKADGIITFARKYHFDDHVILENLQEALSISEKEARKFLSRF